MPAIYDLNDMEFPTPLKNIMAKLHDINDYKAKELWTQFPHLHAKCIADHGHSAATQSKKVDGALKKGFATLFYKTLYPDFYNDGEKEYASGSGPNIKQLFESDLGGMRREIHEYLIDQNIDMDNFTQEEREFLFQDQSRFHDAFPAPESF